MESQKVTKKSSKKKTIIVVSSLAVLAMGLGVTSGLLFHKYFGSGTVTEYEANGNGYAFSNKQIATFMADYTTDTKASKDYTSYSASKMATIALNLYGKEEHTFCQSIGNAAAGSLANQAIRGTFIRNGTKYFEESFSKSNFVDLADRMYEEGDSTVAYTGKTGSSVEVGVFTDTTGITYTNTDYATKFGRNVDNSCSYIISDQTVLLDGSIGKYGEKNSGVPTSTAHNEDGSYTVELELDNYYGVLNYVTQMQSISNLKYKPSFDYVHLTLNLDSTLHLESMETHEHYTAVTSAGVGSAVEGKLRTVYETGGSYEIPDLNTPITYRSEQ